MTTTPLPLKIKAITTLTPNDLKLEISSKQGVVNCTVCQLSEMKSDLVAMTIPNSDRERVYIHSHCMRFLHLKNPNIVKHHTTLECELCALKGGVHVKCIIRDCSIFAHLLCSQVKFKLISTNIPVSF